ncbi:MAG: hypothetical protein R6V85_18330 [Polyangia bacterium]
MSDRGRRPSDPPRPEDLLVLPEPAPLPEDDGESPDPDSLAEYVDDPVETTDSSEAEGMERDRRETERELAGELIGLEEESWVSGREDREDREDPGDLASAVMEDEPESWIDEDGDKGPALDEDWFVDEDQVAADEDGGAEGPLSDELFDSLDPDSWDRLDDGEDDEDEPVEDAMRRLGIALPAEEAEPEPERERVSPGVVMDRQLLGPDGGSATAVAVSGGAPLAVGEALYVLGADGALHPSETALGDRAISVCAHEERLFVGTAGRGALRIDRVGFEPVPVNGWLSMGFERGAGLDRVSTSFAVDGQPLSSGGFRLLGLTGEGQLFFSDDAGRSWSGPLSDAPCRTAAPVEGGDELLLLSAGGRLLRGDPAADSWSELAQPRSLAGLRGGERVRFAATERVVAATSGDRDAPLALSYDGGSSWAEAESLAGVSAIALDPGEPSWIAAAVHRPAERRGSVRISSDGGHNWRTALVTSSRGRGEDAGRVEQLLLDVGVTTRLYVLSDAGVHRLVLKRRGLSQ